MVNESPPEVDFRFCTHQDGNQASKTLRGLRPTNSAGEESLMQGRGKEERPFWKPIAGSYVNRIENDPALNPTGVALKALAYGLGVPPEEVFLRAVGLVESGDKSEAVQLLSRFKELSSEKRSFVLDIVDMLYSKESRRTPKRKPA